MGVYSDPRLRSALKVSICFHRFESLQHFIVDIDILKSVIVDWFVLKCRRNVLNATKNEVSACV